MSKDSSGLFGSGGGSRGKTKDTKADLRAIALATAKRRSKRDRKEKKELEALQRGNNKQNGRLKKPGTLKESYARMEPKYRKLLDKPTPALRRYIAYLKQQTKGLAGRPYPSGKRATKAQKLAWLNYAHRAIWNSKNGG